jgi:hypothetical protein
MPQDMKTHNLNESRGVMEPTSGMTM